MKIVLFLLNTNILNSFNVQCKVYSVHNTVYSEYYAVYSV